MGNKASQQQKQLIPPTGDFLDKPLQFGPYFLLQQIGKGSFGVAYLAVLRRDITLSSDPSAADNVPSCRDLYVFALTNEKRFFVVKRFRVDLEADEVASLSGTEKEQLVSEKKAMFESERRQAAWLRSQVPSHENLVEYITEIEDSEQKTSALVFEYCNCGDIRRLVSRCKDGSGKLIHLTLFEILRIGVQLASGLSVLHEHKIIHRDLALRNLFVHSDVKTGELVFKIGDFGLCLDLGDVRTTSDSGKFGIHVAPEKIYSEKSDVYALGLVLYELLSLVDLSHDTLYRHNTTTLTAERKGIETELKSLHHPGFACVVSRMLVSDPAKRATAAEIHTALAQMLKLTAKKQDAKFRPWLAEIARASASQCTIEYQGLEAKAEQHRARVFDKGQPALLFTIKARDPLGQPRLSGGEVFELTVSAALDAKERKDDVKEAKAEVSLTQRDKGNGSYDVEFVAHKPSRCVVSLALRGQHLPDSPISVVCVERLEHPYAFDWHRIGVAFGPDGSLHVADNHYVHACKMDGSPNRRYNTSLADIRGIAVGSDGLAFVTDKGSRRVCLFRDGCFRGDWSLDWRDNHSNWYPVAIAVDTKADEVFVAEGHHLGKTICVFNCSGKFLRQLVELDKDSIGSIALDSQYIYVVDALASCVSVFDRVSRKLTRRWGGLGDASGQFRNINAIAVSDNRVYVCNGASYRYGEDDRVHVCDTDGKLLFFLPYRDAGIVAANPTRPNEIAVSCVTLPNATMHPITRFRLP